MAVNGVNGNSGQMYTLDQLKNLGFNIDKNAESIFKEIDEGDGHTDNALTFDQLNVFCNRTGNSLSDNVIKTLDQITDSVKNSEIMQTIQRIIEDGKKARQDKDKNKNNFLSNFPIVKQLDIILKNMKPDEINLLKEKLQEQGFIDKDK